MPALTRDEVLSVVIANAGIITDRIMKDLSAQNEADALLAFEPKSQFVPSAPEMTQEEVNAATSKLASDTDTEKLVLKGVGIAIQLAVTGAKLAA